MRFVMPRLPKLLAASAGFALAASFAAAAYADSGAPRGYQYQAPSRTDDRAPPAIGPEAGRYGQVPNGVCFYSGYDPSTNLGQGSGASLGLSRLVCP